jgi:hypothetical protein
MTRQPSLMMATLGQFFIGGFALFVVAEFVMLLIPTSSEYDGVTSLIGLAVSGVIFALPSMLVAMIIGLPLRLVPALRSRWLAHGEITVAGVLLGLIGCAFAAPLTVIDDATGWSGPGLGSLLVAWAVLAFSIAHFVWPMRWRRAAVSRA